LYPERFDTNAIVSPLSEMRGVSCSRVELINLTGAGLSKGKRDPALSGRLMLQMLLFRRSRVYAKRPPPIEA